MPRETYIFRNGELIPKSEAHRSNSSAYVVSDNMPAMRHPITQQFLESKSQFRRITRENNCVEVGNDVQKDARRVEMPDMKRDIARAIRELGG